MKMQKIKISRDTPFNLAGEEVSILEFRQKYGYICSQYLSDEKLINYLENDRSYWFEVIRPKNNFRIGDWVWHEGLKKAFCVMPFDSGINFRPNYVTLEAANDYEETYKRKATPEEIKNNNFYLTCNGSVLIGKNESFYFNNIWKPLIGVISVISSYICANKEYFANADIRQKAYDSEDSERKWDCKLAGVKVGCTLILHEEIVNIAQFLNLKI